MGAVVPSISDRGWITAVPEKMDLLLSYFFESDKIQTYLYKGYVSNLQNLMQQYGNQIPRLCVELRQALEQYFSGYFDTAVVQVDANDNPTVNPTNNITLTISATISDNSVQYSLGSQVEVAGSTFKRVMGVINTGVLPAATTGVSAL